MEFNQIRCFLELASTCHVTKTAERLHIAQPALTQSIRRLEKALGVPLFESVGRNIRLTEYGVFLQKRLGRLMEDFDSIPTELELMKGTRQKTVKIATYAASYAVTELITSYKKMHPEINFKMTQSEEEHSADIEITTRLFTADKQTAGRQQSFTERIYLAVPDSGIYKDKTDIILSEVKNGEFIGLMGSKQLRYICDKFCHHSGFEPKIVFESDNPTAVKNMIAANIGIGFWPEFSWGRMDLERVKLLKITDPICQRDIIITNLNSGSHAVSEFYEYLCSGFAKLTLES